MSDSEYPRAAIVAMSLFVLVAYGVSLYAMSVLLTGKAAGGEFSISLLSAGFGGSAVVAGLLAPLVGRHADDHSVRGITLLGGLLGGVAMVLLAVSQEGWHVLVAFWLFLGPAAALSLYEPAYVAVGQWVHEGHRNRAIGVLSVIAGLAGPIFVPLTGLLLATFGWRQTSAILGVVFLVAGVGASLVYPPHRPKDHREHDITKVRWKRFFGDRRLLYLTLAIVLTFAAMNAVFFHRVAVFEDQGFDVSTIALLAGISGLLTFPGRYLMPRAAGRVAATSLFTVACAGIVVSMIFAIIGSPAVVMVAFFVLFGLFFGLMLPTRAVIMNGWYAGEDFGAVMGKQWSVAAVVGGITPWIVGVTRDALGSYTWPLIGLTGLIAVAALFNEAAAHRSRASEVASL
ncbi:MAG: MFS transporter [Actinomycetia bacterium]|nr:MFS transporter [Actinomycetes bacterium]